MQGCPLFNKNVFPTDPRPYMVWLETASAVLQKVLLANFTPVFCGITKQLAGRYLQRSSTVCMTNKRPSVIVRPAQPYWGQGVYCNLKAPPPTTPPVGVQKCSWKIPVIRNTTISPLYSRFPPPSRALSLTHTQGFSLQHGGTESQHHGRKENHC